MNLTQTNQADCEDYSPVVHVSPVSLGVPAAVVKLCYDFETVTRVYIGLGPRHTHNVVSKKQSTV